MEGNLRLDKRYNVGENLAFAGGDERKSMEMRLH